MAAPKNPKAPTKAQFDDDDIPDIPEEYTADADASSTTLSWDDLAGVGLDAKSANADYIKMNPPTGDWLKDDRWEFDRIKGISHREDDHRDGDISPHGRTFISVMGRPAPRVVNGIDYQPLLFLRVSPDKRYKDGADDEKAPFDLAYKLYLRSREAYLSIHGQELTNLQQLVYLHTEDEVVYRTMNGDNGPVIVDVKPKPKKR